MEMSRQEFISKHKRKKQIYKKFVGVTVSLTIEERKQIGVEASKLELSISDYVRSKIFYDD